MYNAQSYFQSFGYVLCLALLMTCLMPFSSSASTSQEIGHVTGCVKVEDQSQYSGVASLWAVDDGRIPDPRKYIVVPNVTASIRPNGCFDLQAISGSYYLGAVVRTTQGLTMGPPRVGDLVFMSPGPDGDVVIVDVSPLTSVDVGTRNDGWRYEGFTSEVDMGISGQVVDEDGKPVSGLLVFAFSDQAVSGSPLAVSDRTTAQGDFQLRIDKPGVVYLRVKESYGEGMPKPGAYIGIYGSDKPLALEVMKDEVVGQIVIEALQVPEEMTGAKRKR